ncbi:MAG TPA: ATP-binding protein [Gammaproteobacteria bacterium]|nr:ATP-binding protein [Gammaproteobacteria bacterium]
MSRQNDFFADVAALAENRQFRMRRLQVYNWGTFDKLHDIRIAEKGFLFVGRSGSGKSTLLDAIAALLTPPQWLSFNAAAREGERNRRDRNLVSYVRGAWGDRTDSASGEIATHYLRRGTTWSALALTFANGEGRTVTLLHLYWIRGNGTATTDVRRHYLVAEREFDIARELNGFDLDVRGLKRRLTDVDHFGDTFRPYAERLRRLMDIESEQALKLLHKTQSAKNLGDLNTFLREFMLEKPDTFEAADRLVAEFAELDAAHQEVLTARRQLDTLRPARDEHQAMTALDEEVALNERLLEGIDAWTESRRIELLNAAIGELDARILGLEGRGTQQAERLAAARDELRDLETAHRDKGGSDIERLQEERTRTEQQRDDRLRRYRQVEAACQTLDWPVPDHAEAFGERLAEARSRLEAFEAALEAEEAERDAVRDELKASEARFAALRTEIAAMERQPSNIPAHMLDLRRELAGAIGCTESELPFVGELIQVREEAADWRGAIERVLHGFALSLLVEPGRYAALTEYVERTPLGRRLVYYRVDTRTPAGGVEPDSRSLIHKLEYKETVFTPWLDAELRRRFDYACVDNLQDFRKTHRALTRAGQVRHGRDRHEKDDRRAIDDRRHWVLGFDNREKLAHFRNQAAETAAQISHLQKQLSAFRERRHQAEAQRDACNRLVNLQWSDIDVGAVLDRLAALERQIGMLQEGNAELRELGERLSRQREQVATLEKELTDLQTELGMTRRERDTRLAGRAEAETRLAGHPPLDATIRERLDARFAATGELRLERLDDRRRKVERAIHNELRQQRERRGDHVRRIEKAFADFQREWPQAAADMDATLASAPDFLRLLERIERDGLPRHEKRFHDMLREQSSENLAALSTYLSQARKDIRNRMELVNEGLRRAEFNPGTHLQIEVRDRHLPEVQDFLRSVKAILSHAFQADPAQAERRFDRLKQLVGRLAGGTAEDRRWRDLVLDVRQHVEFMGRELGADGEEVEIYRSGAGKSGGQREKLATTCLAAALRYQLGGDESERPTYAAVVLDEAFGKADNEFTELAMRIFERFGFQMIVATPLKAVMTLEPFIGGACFVDITDRRHSATLAIEYDETRQRLDLPEQVRGEELTA